MHARVVLVRRGKVVATWPVASHHRVDLELVDRLARAQLAARRAGYALRLEEVAEDLGRLLELVGLGVEMLGEAELGEEIGVEEVVVTDDPAV